MAQTMRPISQVTSQGTPSSNAHLNVDGATPPDAGDYWAGNDNEIDVLEVLLTDLSASVPDSGTCTVFVYQAQADGDSAPSSGGRAPRYDIEVYEGAIQRASRTGILAAAGSFSLDSNLSFSSSVITDWSDVRIRFTSNGSGGSPAGRRGVAASFIGVSTPDAGAPSDDLLADDIESASEVTTPAVGQTHALAADDVQSTSELTTPAITQTHALSADDIESDVEFTAPALASDGSHALLADDIESASEVTTPTLAQTHVLLAVDVESVSSVSAPVLSSDLVTHALIADDVQSALEISIPSIGQIHALLANDVESISEISAPSIRESGAGHANMAGRSRMAGLVGGHNR